VVHICCQTKIHTILRDMRRWGSSSSSSSRRNNGGGGNPTQTLHKLGGSNKDGGRRRYPVVATPSGSILLGGCILCLIWVAGCVEFLLHDNKNGGDGGNNTIVMMPRLKGGSDELAINNQQQQSSLRQQKKQQQRERPKKEDSNYFPRHYMVFSTSCSSDQNWQSYIFFYYAARVSQPGNVVRIASGCSRAQQDELIRFHETTISKLSPNFSVHFTPDFTKISGDVYKYYNKPFGIQHWLTLGLKYEDNKDIFEDAIIMILDPDMILLRPLTYDFTESNVIIHESDRGTDMRFVEHGRPWASLYGFGDGPFRSVDVRKVFIDHPDSPALTTSKEEQRHNYPGGPPYMATGRDMHAIVNTWCELVPSVHAGYTELLGEMYGWSLAAAHLELPHVLAESFMVSETDMTAGGEGWPIIDQMKDDDICDDSHRSNTTSSSSSSSSLLSMPFVIHYCQSYWIGKWFIGKYRIKSTFLSCDSPLLQEPPTDIKEWKYDYYIKPGGKPYGQKERMKPTTARREQFMICQVIKRLNDAATWYKEQICEAGNANYDKSFIFHHNLDPENNTGGMKNTKW